MEISQNQDKGNDNDQEDQQILEKTDDEQKLDDENQITEKKEEGFKDHQHNDHSCDGKNRGVSASELETDAKESSLFQQSESHRNSCPADLEKIQAIETKIVSNIQNANPLTQRLKEAQRARAFRMNGGQPPDECCNKNSSKASTKKTGGDDDSKSASTAKQDFSKQERKNFGNIKKQLKKNKAELDKPEKELNEDDEAYYLHRCAICFERISERGKPENCIHTFCMDCILGWTKFHNLCPLCKVEIQVIEKYDSLEPDKVCEKIEIEKPVAPAEITDTVPIDNGPQFAEFCYVCRSNEREDEQIVCELCDFEIAHYQCLGFSSVPSQEWFCPRCNDEFQQRQQEDKKKRKLLQQGKSPIIKDQKKSLKHLGRKNKSPPKQRLSKNSNKTPKIEESSDIYAQTEEKDYSDSEEEEGYDDEEDESPPQTLRRSSRRSSEKQSLKNAKHKKDKQKFQVQKG